MTTHRHDPLEDDPAVRPLIDRADAEVRAAWVAEGRVWGRGSCHAFWREKQRVLRDEHGVDWKTPAQINPGIRFD